MYKFLQVSCQSQILTFRDPTIRKIAEKYLQAEMDAKRKKLRPAVEVQEATKEDPSFTRKHLVRTVKRQVIKEDDKRRLVELQACQSRVTCMNCLMTPASADIWARCLQILPQESFQVVPECIF